MIAVQFLVFFILAMMPIIHGSVTYASKNPVPRVEINDVLSLIAPSEWRNKKFTVFGRTQGGPFVIAN